jgi:hypothetical protein
MKSTVFILLLALAVGCVAGPKSDVTGFRGIEWGSAPCTGMEKLDRVDGSYGGVDSYANSGDVLEIGGAKLDLIQYTYWRNRLLSVTILFSGHANFSVVLASLVERYGRGARPNQYLDEYLWNKTSGAMMLKYSDITGDGSLVLFSHAVSRDAENYDKERAKKGANDF